MKIWFLLWCVLPLLVACGAAPRRGPSGDVWEIELHATELGGESVVLGVRRAGGSYTVSRFGVWVPIETPTALEEALSRLDWPALEEASPTEDYVGEGTRTLIWRGPRFERQLHRTLSTMEPTLAAVWNEATALAVPPAEPPPTRSVLDDFPCGDESPCLETPTEDDVCMGEPSARVPPNATDAGGDVYRFCRSGRFAHLVDGVLVGQGLLRPDQTEQLDQAFEALASSSGAPTFTGAVSPSQTLDRLVASFVPTLEEVLVSAE